MSGQGFHHVAIRAADFDATIKFYTEGLQCSVRYEFSVPGRIDRAAFLDACGCGRQIKATVGPAVREGAPCGRPVEIQCFRLVNCITEGPIAGRQSQHS